MVKACARRSPRSSPTKSASLPSGSRSSTATPIVRPMAGERSPAARWSIAGGASVIAARKIHAKLKKIASHILEAAADDIVLEDGAARVAGTDRALPIETLARAAYHQAHLFKGEIDPALTETATYDPRGHVLECLSCLHRQGGCETGARNHREIPGGRGRRPDHQPDDRRRSGGRRRRAGDRQRAAGRNHVRRDRQHPDGNTCGLFAADEP